MRPFDEGTRGGRTRQFDSSLIDHLLHCDMRSGLELQIAAIRVTGIVGIHGPVYVPRVSVVPLDQVRVVAVHRPDEFGDRQPNHRVQLAG